MDASEIKWDYWLRLYLERHCTSRGLSPMTIAAYRGDLTMFRVFLEGKLEINFPDQVRMKDVLDYVEFLQKERRNGVSATNRQIMSIKNFYRAMVAFEEIEPKENPMRDFPKLKPLPKKVPRFLSESEIKSMVNSCDTNCKVGLRDRTLIILLYGTGIRASECAGLRGCDVDLANASVQVKGKGGHERCIPLKEQVVMALQDYIHARGEQKPEQAFFLSMRGKGMSRNAIYERIRQSGQRAKLQKRVSPHKLRHSFATHIIRTERNIQVVSELLGHRHVTSTQIYVHITGKELIESIERHPIGAMVERIEHKMVGVELPFKSAPPKRTG